MKNPLLTAIQANLGKPIDNPALPFTQWLGGRVLKAEEGESEMAFVVRREMTNPAGLLHGGIHAAMLDDVMGMTVAVMGLQNLYVSVNLAVDFLAPARTGETVIASAKVIKTGKTIVYVQGEICDEKGKLLSRATSNLANTGMPGITGE